MVTPSAVLWGGNPRGLLIASGYRVKPSIDGAFLIRTEESYTHTRPTLLYTRDLDKQPGELDRLAQHETIPPTVIPPGYQDEVDALQHSATNGDLSAVVDLLRLHIGSAESADLSGTVQDSVRYLRSISSEGTPIFPTASAHVVVREHLLAHRISLIRALARFAQDPRSAGGDTSDLRAALAAGRLSLTAASHGLADGVALLLTYLGPLLGAASPRMWGFAATRESGPIVFSFGRLVRGRRPGTAELLQTLHEGGGARPEPSPAVDQTVTTAAIQWWVSRLNDLFTWLSDAAVFRTGTGTYGFGTHLQTLLSIEQTFRRVTSILASPRDTTATLALMFTVLDTIEGRFIDTNLPDMLTPRLAQRTLDNLRDLIPSEAQPLILHHAERAVSALRSVEDGFYIADARNTPGQLRVHLPDGTTRDRPIESATATYLAALRNATHGFGAASPRGGSQARQKDTPLIRDALLAHHTGDLDPDLASLAYLYLLDILVHPERTAAKIRRTAGSRD